MAGPAVSKPGRGVGTEAEAARNGSEVIPTLPDPSLKLDMQAVEVTEPMSPSSAKSPASRKRSRQGSFNVPIQPTKALSVWSWVLKDEVLDENFGRAVLVAAIAAAYHDWRKARREGGKFRDTKTFGFVLENSSVLFLGSLRSMLPEVERVRYSKDSAILSCRKLLWNCLMNVAGGLCQEYGSVILLHFISTRVYSHIAYFRPLTRNPSPLTRRFLLEWSKGNAVAHILGAVVQAVVESCLPDPEYDELCKAPNNSFLEFVRNFAVLRVVNDIFFYMGHRLLHIHPVVYRFIHKRHHTHMTTNVSTNAMFTPLDVLIEAAIPIGLGVTVISKACGFNLGRFEQNLMTTYMGWYDAGTHVGKSIPLISLFAPLSLIYNKVRDIDAQSIWFHELHHNKVRCNYGITAWLDMLFGSAVWKR